MRERNKLYKIKSRAKKTEEVKMHKSSKNIFKAVQSYSHNVKCDKYLYHDLMEAVGKLQKERKFVAIRKLINSVTYVKKVMTTNYYLENPKDPQSPYIAASAIGKDKRSVISMFFELCKIKPFLIKQRLQNKKILLAKNGRYIIKIFMFFKLK